MGRKGPLLQMRSLGVHTLRVKDLNNIIGISRGDKDGFTVAEYVAECLGMLDIYIVENQYPGAIVLGKRESRHERWWDELRLPTSVDIKTIEVNDSRYGYQRRLVCYSLSILREVIHVIREAKLTTKVSRSRREYLEKLSSWGLASAILLMHAVFREVYVIGERRNDMRWCCEWMTGEADENGLMPDRFLVDLPLKLVKGYSMMVITHGAFAVRIDTTKALKIMRVGKVFRKDLKVHVLRAGAGDTLGTRSTKVKVAPGRYVRVRDCSAVITTRVLFPKLKRIPLGYSSSRRVIYLD